jgi:hypothetical protein
MTAIPTLKDMLVALCDKPRTTAELAGHMAMELLRVQQAVYALVRQGRLVNLRPDHRKTGGLFMDASLVESAEDMKARLERWTDENLDEGDEWGRRVHRRPTLGAELAQAWGIRRAA